MTDIPWTFHLLEEFSYQSIFQLGGMQMGMGTRERGRKKIKRDDDSDDQVLL